MKLGGLLHRLHFHTYVLAAKAASCGKGCPQKHELACGSVSQQGPPRSMAGTVTLRHDSCARIGRPSKELSYGMRLPVSARC